jgi:hypothetical protein
LALEWLLNITARGFREICDNSKAFCKRENKIRQKNKRTAPNISKKLKPQRLFKKL